MLMVGPHSLPSAVWLNTTSRMTWREAGEGWDEPRARAASVPAASRRRARGQPARAPAADCCGAGLSPAPAPAPALALNPRPHPANRISPPPPHLDAALVGLPHHELELTPQRLAVGAVGDLGPRRG
jgi:hypothetical protein